MNRYEIDSNKIVARNTHHPQNGNQESWRTKSGTVASHKKDIKDGTIRQSSCSLSIAVDRKTRNTLT